MFKGFYRVNYDQKNWKLILIQLITNPCKIHELNRAQIIDDTYHLAKAGLIPYYYYISLLEYLLMEDHVTPWNVATKGLSSIMNSIRQYPLEYMKFKVNNSKRHLQEIIRYIIQNDKMITFYYFNFHKIVCFWCYYYRNMPISWRIFYTKNYRIIRSITN